MSVRVFLIGTRYHAIHFSMTNSEWKYSYPREPCQATEFALVNNARERVFLY